MTTTTHAGPHGLTVTTLSNGNRRATITHDTDGTYRVALYVNCPDHPTWVDGATYKSERGALRKAQEFTK